MCAPSPPVLGSFKMTRVRTRGSGLLHLTTTCSVQTYFLGLAPSAVIAAARALCAASMAVCNVVRAANLADVDTEPLTAAVNVFNAVDRAEARAAKAALSVVAVAPGALIAAVYVASAVANALFSATRAAALLAWVTVVVTATR